jgi:anti-sigma-K factor RskA
VNYRKHPQLIDRLAAEYVLGTLRGRARARFARLISDDAAVRRTVGEWEERLMPMAAAVAERQPPQRLWRAIKARVDTPANKPRGWGSLDFWRNLSLAASGCAVALLVAFMIRPPEVLRVPMVVEVPSKQRQESYVATLTDKDGKVVAVAYAARNSNELWVRRLNLPAGSNQAHELWALPAQPGGAPRSLGLIPADEKGNIRLVAAADQSLRDVPALAISLEPEGGSKTGLPTGPVLASGPCIKFW